jgi:hypothetical protein
MSSSGGWPEALPRRYGLYEPPQYVYADTGREHFASFLAQHVREFVVWYPRRPFTFVGVTVHRTVGATRRGFRTHCLTVDVARVALAQPGWPRALRDFWLAVAALLPCFYGHVRTLRGAERHGGAYFPDEDHPVVNGWWRGLPQGPAHAVVLGEPYLAQWDGFTRVATDAGALRWISADPWDRDADAMALAGGVPDDVAQRSPSRSPDGNVNFEVVYPPVWPFGPTHDPIVP